MSTSASGTITPKLSAIGKAFLQTSIQDDTTGLKRERADSLKQMLPPPPSRRPKAKDKPTPIVTTGLEAIESAPSSLSSARGGEKSNPRRWSKAEDESLRLAVERSGERNWKAIADQVAGRNHTQCLQRWTKVLKPGLIKGHWTPDEDAKLKTLVAEGRKNWGQVAAQIAGRTSKQCRERWCNHLDPNINKGNYTKEEDDLIIDMQAKLGNRWSVIAQRLVGRTEDAVKIRWKSLMRSRRPKEAKEEKNEECSDTSELSEKPNASSTSGTPLTNRSKAKKTELKPDVKAAVRTPNKSMGTNSFLSARPLVSQYPLHAAPGPPRPASFFMPGQSTQAPPPVLPSSDTRPPYPLPPPSASPYLPRTFDNIRPSPSSTYPQQMLPSYMQPPSSSQTSSSFKSQSYRPYASYSSAFGQQQYDQHHPPLPQHHSQQIPSAFYSQHPGVPPLLPSRLNTPREEWGTSNTPRSQLILNEGQASEYELFHQQRLRLMVKERERHGPALSPAASPGQAMLTKELEANKERQKRQAIMQNGWKNAVVASAEPSELSKPPSEFEEESRYDGFLEKEQNLAEIDPTDEEYTVPLPAVE